MGFRRNYVGPDGHFVSLDRHLVISGRKFESPKMGVAGRRRVTYKVGSRCSRASGLWGGLMDPGFVPEPAAG